MIFLLNYAEIDFYALRFPTYEYAWLLRSYNVKKVRNFFIIYQGNLFFSRNDVKSFEPTQLSSKFMYGFENESFSIYLMHVCENTINYKPYDIKRYDAIFFERNFKNWKIYTGWTLNNILSDYGMWFGLKGNYGFFEYEFSIATDGKFKRVYPFVSLWLFNLAGLETYWFPNSADSLKNDPQIPKKDFSIYNLLGVSTGFLYENSQVVFMKIIPLRTFKYNLFYSYNMHFQKPIYINVKFETYTVTDLLYPKWIIIRLKGGFKRTGLKYERRLITNLKSYEEPENEKVLSVYANYTWKFLSIEYNYRISKPNRLRRHDILLIAEGYVKHFYLFLKFNPITYRRVFRVGVKIGNLAIYYHKDFQTREDFDFYNEYIESFGFKWFVDG